MVFERIWIVAVAELLKQLTSHQRFKGSHPCADGTMTKGQRKKLLIEMKIWYWREYGCGRFAKSVNYPSEVSRGLHHDEMAKKFLIEMTIWYVREYG